MTDQIKKRFMNKVAMIPEAGCWIWTAADNATGYGRFGMNGYVDFAHRASWILFKGAIPEKMYVCHHCDVRLCVNPDHLFIGTAKDNMIDASKKGRIRVPSQSYASNDTHQVAKLTNTQVREIRESSERPYKLAKKYGVHYVTIWNVRRRHTFRDVK